MGGESGEVLLIMLFFPLFLESCNFWLERNKAGLVLHRFDACFFFRPFFFLLLFLLFGLFVFEMNDTREMGANVDIFSFLSLSIVVFLGAFISRS